MDSRISICALSVSGTGNTVFSGTFIALTVIFTHIFAVQATFIRFGFLPTAVFAAVFGPLRGGRMAAAADLIGCLFNH